jgi:hypothetical protein
MLADAVSVGALTGLRSMAGPAALAGAHGGALRGVTSVMALGVMIVDKTSIVGNRIDLAPLTGRAVIGALAGGFVAGPRPADRLFGAALGASAAVVAAHLAFRARTQSPLPNAVSGMIEDAVVAGLVAWFAARRR